MLCAKRVQQGRGFFEIHTTEQRKIVCGLQQSKVFCKYLVFAATILGFSFFFIVMFFEWLFLHKWHESAHSEGSES